MCRIMAMESYHRRFYDIQFSIARVVNVRALVRLGRPREESLVKGFGTSWLGSCSLRSCTVRACSLSTFGVDRRGNLAVFQDAFDC